MKENSKGFSCKKVDFFLQLEYILFLIQGASSILVDGRRSPKTHTGTLLKENHFRS